MIISEVLKTFEMIPLDNNWLMLSAMTETFFLDTGE